MSGLAYLLPVRQAENPPFSGIVFPLYPKHCTGPDGECISVLINNQLPPLKEVTEKQQVCEINELTVEVIPSISIPDLILQVVVAFAPHQSKKLKRTDIFSLTNRIVHTHNPTTSDSTSVSLRYDETLSKANRSIQPPPLIGGVLTLHILLEMAPISGDSKVLTAIKDKEVCTVIIHGSIRGNNTEIV